MEKYLNIIHFCFYKAECKLHLLFNKINPFRLLLKISAVRKRLEKKGITDFQKEYDHIFVDKHTGWSMIIAGGTLWGGMAIFFFSLLIMFNIPISITYIIACGLLSGLTCYFFVFRSDKYLEYFDRYEKWSEVEKRKYSWLTFASVAMVFLLLFFGLKT